jgi:hypothetical protein
MRLRCIGQHFHGGCVWIAPIASAFRETRPPRRSWRNVFGMNTSAIRDVERKIKELNQL